MGKTLYFDCFSGASGDMILGALLDAGVPLEALRGALGSLAIEHGVLSTERVLRAGISATKFRLLEPAHAAPMSAQGDTSSAPSGELRHGHVHTHSHRHSDGPGHRHSSDGPADRALSPEPRAPSPSPETTNSTREGLSERKFGNDWKA